jgi:hypothetical protein
MTMFAKRHYVAIAKTIKANHRENVPALVIELADMFARDNPLFKRSRFYDACGYDPTLMNKED